MVKIIYKKAISGISDDEKEFSDKILNDYGDRVEKKLGEDLTLEVYFKKYGKVKINEYEVSLRISCSGSNNCSKYFIESNATERDFGKAVHNALKKMDTEIEHKLHVSDQRNK
jgi:hypothetical protein